MTEILATEATLSTLKVEIKALTVSGKQMTLAVFRQLPAFDWVFDENGEYGMGGLVPWGRVRYSIKDEGHLWLVAERGGTLRRVEIPDPHDAGTPTAIFRRAIEELQAAQKALQGRFAGTHYLRLRGKTNIYPTAEVQKFIQEIEPTLPPLKQRAQICEQSLEDLEDLPQLFIAV